MNRVNWRLSGFWLAIGWLGMVAPLASAAKPPETAPKWGRFEHVFKSSVTYPNPLEDATLTVQFTSPLGDSMTVPGFWNGGKTWLVRFSPDMPGKWKFKTTCSDAANQGLQDVTGEFLCTVATGPSVFNHHGPMHVARDHRHLEYADHRPFFWLADTAWDGARWSSLKEWERYAQLRSSEKFTAVQWIAAPGTNSEGRSAFTGGAHLKPDLEFFRKKDAKVDELNNAGLLDAIVPLSELALNTTNRLETLPESQAVLLLRYLVARWGANDVAWLLACDGAAVERWKHIGRAVFGNISHAPVILFTGESYWALDEFRAERWVDVFGYQTGQDISDDNLQWMLAGPVPRDWKREPARPFINIAPPYENEPAGKSQPRITALDVRRSAIWSLLLTPTAGVGYGAHGVWDWEKDADAAPVTPGNESWKIWEKSLYLPAARQMDNVAAFFQGVDFNRLLPAQELLLEQPGADSPAHHISVAATAAGDLTVAYTPERAAVSLRSKVLQPSASATWFSPSTGLSNPTAASFSLGRDDRGTNKVQFIPPGEGDWLLLITTPAYNSRFRFNGNSSP